MELNLSLIRSYFPALAGDWIYMDNAGGSQTVKFVGERLQDYLYNTNVQLGASYDISQKAGERVLEARKVWAEMINAEDHREVVFGPSTTQLLQNLSKSMVQLFKPGDEVIVTDCDHEANIGPWINMEKMGISVKFWKINKETLELHLDDLEKLMTSRTRLVAFTHVSNILGTINPVKEITSFVHQHNAMVCVDGVAYAPHRLVDVKDLDADFYAFSFYKVYGPHYSLLYVRKKHLDVLPAINHYFITRDDVPYKLQPGNVNFELTYSLLGIYDYLYELARKMGFDHENGGSRLRNLFDHLADHEQHLSGKLLEYLNNKNNIRIIGKTTADPHIRVPTISFIVEGKTSSEITQITDKQSIGIRFGDFYARRLIDALGLGPQDGVVRVSMVHYNTPEEVERLIDVLEGIRYRGTEAQS